MHATQLLGQHLRMAGQCFQLLKNCHKLHTLHTALHFFYKQSHQCKKLDQSWKKEFLKGQLSGLSSSLVDSSVAVLRIENSSNVMCGAVSINTFHTDGGTLDITLSCTFPFSSPCGLIVICRSSWHSCLYYVD